MVATIIGILAATVLINLNESTAQSRDAQRQADLRNLQNAIELYKNFNGHYPAGCNGAGAWSGQTGTTYACGSGNQYIVDLAPQFIPALPKDPKLNGNDSGYIYTVNNDGTSYKLLVARTVESEQVDYDHTFKSCDATNSNTGICDQVYPSNNKPTKCGENNAFFRISYGLWGGFPDELFDCPHQRCEDNVEDVFCKMP